MPATCKLETFDMTVPGGRMSETFRSTSNPRELIGLLTVYEDSPIQEVMVAVGYGKDIWGEQIVRWTKTSVTANIVDYDVGQYEFLELFVISIMLRADFKVSWEMKFRTNANLKKKSYENCKLQGMIH